MTEQIEKDLKSRHRWIDYGILIVVTGLVFMIVAASLKTFAEDSPLWVYILGLFVSGAIGWAAGFSGDPQVVPTGKTKK